MCPDARTCRGIVETQRISVLNALLREGKKHFIAARSLIQFTGNSAADELLNDLERHPHAFVLACLMDRQVKAEKAWLIPYHLRLRLNGDFSIKRLVRLGRDEIDRLMREPECLHRFVDTMSGIFHDGVQRIAHQYDGDASLIWKGKPSSAEVIFRFIEFKGAGPKIAGMAANILAREFKVPLGDYYAIDVSADVHVRRVFERLGLTCPNPSVEQVIFRARALHPEFPGLLDRPCWRIGRNWCRPSNPECTACPMKTLCPSSAKISSPHAD